MNSGIHIRFEPRQDLTHTRKELRARNVQLVEQLNFFILLGLIALTSIPHGTVEAWWIGAFECGAFALGGAWGAAGLYRQTWRLTDGILLALPAALLVLAFVQILPLVGSAARVPLSADPYQTRLWILHFGALLIVGALLLQYTNNLSRLRSLVFVIISIGVISALFAIARQLMFVPSPGSGSSLTAEASFGQFINRNHFALLMEMTLGLVAGIVIGGGARHGHLPFYLAIIAVLWIALVWSNSRGGIMSMIGQSLLLALIWNLRFKRTKAGRRIPKPFSRLRHLAASRGVRAILTLGLVIFMCLGVVWVGGDSLRQRIETLPRELKTTNPTHENSSRVAIWKATLRMIKDHPVAGVGFGGFSTALPRYHEGSGLWIPEEAHNDYLEITASGGIFALLLAVSFAAIVTRRAWFSFTNSPDGFRRAAALGALVGLFGLMIHSLVDFGAHVTINALIIVSLIVVATVRIPAAKIVNC